MAATAVCAAILADMEARASAENRAGMARFGITVDRAFGISIPVLREMARPHRGDHALAQALWASGWHEARILAGYVEDPAAVTPEQMDAWAGDLDSWDLCDQIASNLFAETPHAIAGVARLAADEREYVRRCAFAMAAALAVHGRDVADPVFIAFLDLARDHARDGRNYVRKAVNWAIRQIGKRNGALHAEALALARRLAADSDPTARWVGSDAARELGHEKTLARLARKEDRAAASPG